jgi:hypothetical protein
VVGRQGTDGYSSISFEGEEEKNIGRLTRFGDFTTLKLEAVRRPPQNGQCCRRKSGLQAQKQARRKFDVILRLDDLQQSRGRRLG